MQTEAPSLEKLLASAVDFLMQGHEKAAAGVLLLCSAYITRRYVRGEPTDNIKVHLTGPRRAYDILADENNPTSEVIERAIQAVLPYPLILDGITIRAHLTDPDPSWRIDFLEAVHGQGIHNQGNPVPEGSIVVWRNLRFRSESEARIAAALDATRALFLPNCMARLTTSDGRRTREPDFLVCHDGKWGILEVDGPFHEGSAAQDHDRDRLFRDYGIRVVERFKADECYHDPPGVVRRFLALLEKNG